MGKDFEKGKYTSPEGSRTWEYLSAVICSVGFTCIGFVTGWNAPSLAELTSPNSRILITSDDASTLTVCLSIGHLIALPASLLLVDRIGRKNSILLGILPMLLNWGMIILANNVTMLLAARVMAGFSTGLITGTFGMFMVEILSTDVRGPMGAIYCITFYSGVLFMFAIAPYLGVRLTACVCMGSTILFLICFWFMPESPYFLMRAGRVEEAEAVLEKLRGKTDVADELELINATIKEKGKVLVKLRDNDKSEDAGGQSAFSKLFTVQGNLKAFFIAMVLMILQHSCGFGMILNYCHIILDDVDSGLDVYSATLIFSSIQIGAATLNVFIMNKFRRRPLLFSSSITSGFLLIVIATYFYLKKYTSVDVTLYGMITLCAVFALVLALNLGLITVPGLVQNEIFSTDVKVLANCVIGITGSLMSIATTKAHLLIATSWGLGHSVPFFGYAFGTLLCVGILVRWLPETKDKTLLEIQRELNA